MDTLSLGVTFRASHKIYDVEAAAVMALVIGEEAGAFGKDLLFTYVIECLGDAQTTFPDLGSEKDVDVYAEHVRSHPAARSLSWWGQQEKMLVRIRAKHALSKANYVERMTASLEKNRSHFLNADGSLNRQRALREEYLWALKNEILPRLRKMLLVRSGPEGMLEVFRSFVRRNGEDGERRLVEFVGLMPSLKVFCEVMAARTMNPARAVRGQDFWDADHASIGCAHADAFATLDRGLLDLVENRCATPKRRGCRILHDIDEVTGYVDSLHRAADVSSVEVSEASGTQLHLGANQDG
jgi:hypothetical protein